MDGGPALKKGRAGTEERGRSQRENQMESKEESGQRGGIKKMFRDTVVDKAELQQFFIGLLLDRGRIRINKYDSDSDSAFVVALQGLLLFQVLLADR